MPAPKKYPVEVRDRSIRLVEDLLADPDLQLSVTGACTRVGEQLGINSPPAEHEKNHWLTTGPSATLQMAKPNLH